MSLRLPRNWDFSTFRAETAKIARSKSVMPGEGSPGSTHTGFKRSMEKPLKTGWLKKQRSIVKNWQLRFFVLRGNVLTYHKDDRESAVQGTIPLFSCHVNELPSNADDKFLFEIIPAGSSTDREREREAYVLMATSQSEMEEWVRSIRKAIGSRSNGVFGKSLSDIMVYEKKFGPRLVPILVEKCAEFIREHGLNEEGIFRLPGQDNQVKQFREAFDAGERPSFPCDTDVHTVGSLLKLYLRELPEPVVPWTQYQDFLDSTLMLDATTAAGKEKLEEQISLLPKVNYNLLSYICRFLFEVQQNSKVNKMSIENLATVMGVNLFKPQVEDAISMMKGTPMIQKVMTVMIRHHELLFPPSKDMLPSPLPSKKSKSKKNSNPRSFVGWESAECEVSSLSESPEEEEMDTPEEERKDLWSSKTGSEDTPLSPSSPFSSATDTWPDSPRKRTQTLPSLGCPPAGRGREPSWERWSRFQESFNENEEKTFSEDIFKLLDLQKVTLFSGGQKSEKEKVEGQKDTEDTGLHKTGSDVVDKQIDAVKPQAQSTTPVPKPRPSNDVTAPAVSREKTVEPTAAALQKSNPAQPENTDSTNIISSLQQKNKELSATVAKLQAALEAERRCKAALEILLRNAEHSRDEALVRNEQLNREIQEFLNRPTAGPS
ncbi:rho GTPase-activating protein 25-like isoform X1 [Sinocyclocheilus anshuiensis]|uniref:rho GTPase-activating protein 25-like isoform X1 n=1 Tax=Sinocyclocheilus anshuiensis TaxID=1608454 RepID=UPI0007BA2865|nr:PREDICTED: rho GTPase-activating protein 25-like isoform X1 [Sinocyclocheilus anshuiensis]